MTALRNIYYLAPAVPLPVGGIQKLYQHVDTLNANGFNAFILHDRPGHRYGWRKSQTQIAYFQLSFWRKAGFRIANHRRSPPIDGLAYPWALLGLEANLYTLDENQKQRPLPILDRRDVLVLPDYLCASLYPYLRQFSIVVANFTAYHTFNGMTIQDVVNDTIALPYQEDSLGCIVGSADTENYLRLAFPHLPIYRCQFGVDTDLFAYCSQKQKKVTFMPRKCREHLVQVLSILRLRGKMKDWVFTSLEDLDQAQLVRELQTSAIFLSTSYQEGFGLPPAEALACGTLVVGYDGEAGREFLIPPSARTVSHGNIIEYVQQVEQMAMKFETQPETYLRIGRDASDRIKESYPINGECASVVKTWKQIAHTLDHLEDTHVVVRKRNLK